MSSDRPPEWLERILLIFVSARDRESIAGDLLEEYREERLPRLGSLRANSWYLRQSMSFAAVRITGGPRLRQVLTALCLFIVAAGIWLAVMENILKHNGYPGRSAVATCIVVQGLATLFALVIPGHAVFRAVVVTGAAGIVALGVWAVVRIWQSEHFEGFVLVIGLALIVQGSLTMLVLLRRRWNGAG